MGAAWQQACRAAHAAQAAASASLTVLGWWLDSLQARPIWPQCKE